MSGSRTTRHRAEELLLEPALSAAAGRKLPEPAPRLFEREIGRQSRSAASFVTWRVLAGWPSCVVRRAQLTIDWLHRYVDCFLVAAITSSFARHTS